MSVLGVIPARLGSTRLPEKLIRRICDKFIIQWVWERVKQCRHINHLVIATDHEKVQRIAQSFGATVVMTSPEHQSGTDRILEVARKRKCALVVNIQGDEPLIKPQAVDKLVTALRRHKTIPMATLCYHSENKKTYLDPNVVKVVKDKQDHALYFSRSPIPFFRDQKHISFYKHIGIYAYRRSFLLKIPRLRESFLEEAERLEQLRMLENGWKILAVEVPYDSQSVDTLNDLNEVERILSY